MKCRHALDLNEMSPCFRSLWNVAML